VNRRDDLQLKAGTVSSNGRRDERGEDKQLRMTEVMPSPALSASLNFNVLSGEVPGP
jgi:hypothetical protein